MKYEQNNPNIYLANTIVDINDFNPKKAEKNIQMASKLNNEENLISIINSIKLITNFLNLNLKFNKDIIYATFNLKCS